ncbi:MAG: ABC transporter ATP-binding protein [Clostridiales bacterium]|nr:ABC transporter ATP-binding protein [Clostridiales bacterium]
MISKFMKKHGWKYIPGILFLALNSRIQTLAPAALGKAIDMLESEVADKALVFRQAGVIFLIAVGVFVTRFIWRMFIVMNARTMEVFLREELFRKLQRLPISFFAKQRSGDLMAYATNDVGAVRMTFGPVLAMSINGIITGALAIFSMVSEVDRRLTGFALLPIPIAAAGIIIIGNLVRVRFRKVQALFAKLSGFVNESIMGIRVIKTFAREDEWLEDFTRISADMRDANIRLTSTSSKLDPITAITFGLSFAISLIYGGTLVSQGLLPLGSLVAFQGYLILLERPVIQLGRIVNMMQRGLASYKRLSGIYNEPEIPEKEMLPYPGEIRGAISARNLTFTYPGMSTPALRNISFDLKAGETLGIAGPTGSGKTTLVSLILKFYDPPEGTLFIDGVDINDIPALSIRENTGYVPQDGFLFSTGIADNISFYQPGIDEEKIRQAAELAGIADEIESFPNKYDTLVGERGTHLSGGQKQRIALARALIRDPRILILDDTLSAVDNITEQAIVSHINGILSEKTSVIISHRLSALRSASKIIWLRDGEITESGTHEELMALRGEYYATYTKQMKEAQQHGQQ